MLTERYHIDAIRAFELHARLSQEANTKLADIARQLVEHDHPRPDPHRPTPGPPRPQPECVGALLNRRIQAAEPNRFRETPTTPRE